MQSSAAAPSPRYLADIAANLTCLSCRPYLGSVFGCLCRLAIWIECSVFTPAWDLTAARLTSIPPLFDNGHSR